MNATSAQRRLAALLALCVALTFTATHTTVSAIAPPAEAAPKEQSRTPDIQATGAPLAPHRDAPSPSSTLPSLDPGYGPQLKPGRPFTSRDLVLPEQKPWQVAQRIKAALRRASQEPPVATARFAWPELGALAAGLNDDPRLIYEYVRNHFDYTPLWGLLNNPRETYLAKKGGAFDLCALLVELLNAAGYETRFVFGTVRIPLAQAMNWVGASAEISLQRLFSFGGVPREIQGDMIQISHVWVKVKIDGTWYPLDPSFKAYEQWAGINLAQAMGYDQGAFLAAAQSGATITADYARQINGANIKAQLATYADNLVSYLQSNTPFAGLDDVIGGRSIVPQQLDGYPSQLPYEVQAVTGEAATLPADVMYVLRIQLPGIDYSCYLSDIAGERMTIFYVPATPADAAAITAAGGIYNLNPAYAVNMRPELRIGGQLIATGSAASLGDWQILDATITMPIFSSGGQQWWVSLFYRYVKVGAPHAVVLMQHAVSPQQLGRHYRLLEENRAAGSPADTEAVLGQALYTMGLAYFNQGDACNQLSARLAGVVPVRSLAGLLAKQDLAVLESVWIGGVEKAKRIGPASFGISVDLDAGAGISAADDRDRARGYSLSSTGLKGSAIEHGIIEQMQETPALSTVQVLRLANEQGLKLYHLDSSNVDAILPLLDYDADLKDDLRDDVEWWGEVIVPERGLHYHDWSGTGWYAFDPASGIGASMITGGLARSAPWPSDSNLLGGRGVVTGTVQPATAQETLEAGEIESTSGQTCNDPQPDAPNNAGDDPVDTATGSFLHASTDLAFGVLGHPIRFERVYVSEDHLDDGPLGFGWSHSYEIRLVESSDWSRGFGFGRATEAAAAIVEAYVALDISSTEAGALPHQRIMIGAQNAHWVLDGLTQNVVTVFGPAAVTRQYVELSDGSYAAPPGDYSTLVRHADGTYTVVEKDGSQTDFDGLARARRLVDANGNSTILTYDAGGKLIQVTDAVGRSIDLTYNGGHLTQITDPAGRSQQYEYDGAGNLLRHVDAMGGTTTYTYDGEHRLLSVTDPEAIPFTTNVYDEFGRVVSQLDGRGGSMSLRYGDVRSTAVDAMGYETVYVYDRYRRLVARQDPLGYTTTMTYDANGNVLSDTNGNGGTTTYGYDARGNLASITDPMGYITAFAHDAQDNVTSLTDGLGRTTTFAYDARRNLTQITDPLGGKTQLDYDSTGQITHFTDANGHAQSSSYDAHGNMTQTTDAAGHITSMTFDILGRLLTEVGPDGSTSSFSYDLNDNVTALTDPLGNMARHEYDGNGLLVSVTDARGSTTRYVYDGQSNLLGVTDALGSLTTYEYDANHNLTRITDANGHVTQYQRDALGQATRIVDALGRAASFTYDGNGNLVTRTKADGSEIRYDYDADDRVTRVSYPDGSAAEYAYDAVHNIISESYGTWSAVYTYDVLNRMMRQELPGDSVSVSYAYDAVGNPLRVQAHHRTVMVYEVAYDYDPTDRLTLAADQLAGHAITYTHDAAGNLATALHSSGATTCYTYDITARVTDIEHRDADSGIISGWHYTYDELGSPTQVVRATPNGSLTTSYSYDALDRLVKEAYARYHVDYQYDAVGNRTRMVSPLGTVYYSYDAANQLLSAGQTTFTYDANGNQISRVDARGAYGFAYDYEDRLTQVTAPGDVITVFRYDAEGRRTAVDGPNGERYFVNDGLRVILEGVPSGPDTFYVYADGELALSRRVGSAGSAMEVAQHDDAIGSVSGLSDGSGAALGAYSHDAFGRPQGRPAGLDSPYRFMGELAVRAEEAMSELYLMGFRFYDASIGRFTTCDPLDPVLEQPKSLNRYVYAYDNPLRYLDPTGLRPRHVGPLKWLSWHYPPGVPWNPEDVVVYNAKQRTVEIHLGGQSKIDGYLGPDVDAQSGGYRYKIWKPSNLRWLFTPGSKVRSLKKAPSIIIKVIKGTGLFMERKPHITTDHAVTGCLG